MACLFCGGIVPPRKLTGQGSKGLTKKFCCERHRVYYHTKLGRLKERDEFLAAYGNKCDCCGEEEKEFLSLDHINGGGYKHRKSTGTNIYVVARREGYPKDKYRVLCYNCNLSIGFYGYCPHQKGGAK
jgi:hypothetical protein